jgi:hypothetical protein
MTELDHRVIPQIDRSQVIFPRKCEGICPIGDGALKLVGGILSAQCDGPGLAEENLTALLVTDHESGVVWGELGYLNGGEDVCGNHRARRVAREFVDRTLSETRTASTRG